MDTQLGTAVDANVRTTNPSISISVLRLARAQKNLPAGTQLENLAPAAIRLACITTAAPMPDEPVTPVCPMFARHQLHQIELDLFRVLVFRETKPL